MKKNNLKKIYNNYYRRNFGKDFSKLNIDNQIKGFYRKYKFIEKIVNFRSGMDVLEIGSGFGALYELLSDKKINYLGIEMDKEVVDFANKYFVVDKFHHQSFEEFGLKNRFDVIFAIEVLEHFVDPITNIKKIRRLLKDKGVFVGTTPYPSKYTNLANDTHYYVLHPENWKKFFLNSGFKEVFIYPMSLVPFLWRISKHLSFTLPFYLPINYFISTCLIIAKV